MEEVFINRKQVERSFIKRFQKHLNIFNILSFHSLKLLDSGVEPFTPGKKENTRNSINLLLLLIMENNSEISFFPSKMSQKMGEGNLRVFYFFYFF